MGCCEDGGCGKGLQAWGNRAVRGMAWAGREGGRLQEGLRGKHKSPGNTGAQLLLPTGLLKEGATRACCCGDVRCAAAPAPAGTAAPAPLRSRTLKDEPVTLPEA